MKKKKLPTLKIEAVAKKPNDLVCPQDIQIFLSGKELFGVIDLTLILSGEELPKVNMTLLLSKIEVDKLVANYNVNVKILEKKTGGKK